MVFVLLMNAEMYYSTVAAGDSRRNLSSAEETVGKSWFVIMD
jgi:hypothetical protein